MEKALPVTSFNLISAGKGLMQMRSGINLWCLQNEIKTAVYCKRQLLARAFDIMKVECNGKVAVTPNRWVQLMAVILPTKSAAQIELLMKVMDINGDNYICESM